MDTRGMPEAFRSPWKLVDAHGILQALGSLWKNLEAIETIGSALRNLWKPLDAFGRRLRPLKPCDALGFL